MRSIILFLVLVLSTVTAFPQRRSPYKLRWAVDLPVSAGFAGLSYAGLKMLRDKPYLDSAKIVSLNRDQIGRFNRGATRHYDSNAESYANLALYTSFALPGLLMLNPNVRAEGLKVGALYLETMSIMGAAYTLIVSQTHRIRPYVYNPDVPFYKKMGRGTTNSFYAGHPAAAAASTFFLAKVFADYNPDSKLRPFLYSAAIIPPAVVAYFRYRGGQHFPTDILAGIPLGAAIGILVPQLHKSKNENLSLVPTGNGLLLTYHLR